METALEILNQVASVLGFPAALGLAWAAFVIRDLHRRVEMLTKSLAELEKAMQDVEKQYAAELQKVREKFEQKIEAENKERREELRAIYTKIDDMAKSVAQIAGYLFKGHVKREDDE